MNISHIEVPDDFVFPDNLIQDIFDHQLKLADKYKEIEGHPEFPIPQHKLDDRHSQAHIKDFAWRTTEELGEMFYAQQDSSLIHTHEELGDALHFLAEMSIISGYDISARFQDPELKHQPIDYMFYQKAKHDWDWVGDSATIIEKKTQQQLVFADFIIELGWCMNHLKSKMWKQTPMPTDWEAYENQLDKVWIAFACICLSMGVGSQELYLLYYKKNVVNQFRIRSNY